MPNLIQAAHCGADAQLPQQSSLWLTSRSRFASVLICLIAALPCRFALAQNDSAKAQDEAGAYFEADEARKAVATIAEAAARDPKDRVLGAMLYAGIRDHVWHVPQTLPVKLGGPVKALAFNPDGTKLATASENGELLLLPTTPLDQEQADAQRVKLAHQGEVVGLAFSKDGQRLAVASKSGAVEIWQLDGAKIVFTGAAAPDGNVTAFARATEADLIAIGTETGAIQVFDVAAGKLTSSLQQSGGAVKALALSRSGKKLASAGSDPSAQVWDAATGKQIGTGAAHKAPIRSVDFSRDERYVVSGSEDKTA